MPRCCVAMASKPMLTRGSTKMRLSETDLVDISNCVFLTLEKMRDLEGSANIIARLEILDKKLLDEVNKPRRKK